MNTRSNVSIFLVALIVNITLVPSVFAQTIGVTGNGAESKNTASITDTNKTTVEQTNTADVTNSVDTQAETGGNIVGKNSDSTETIATGNATTENDITNEMNQSVVTTDCCDTASTATTITENGAGSENTVQNTSTTKTSVTTINGAKIVNNIKINANTGRNRISHNTGGDVVIKTGDVTVNNKIVNGPVNVNKVTRAKGSKELKSALKITGNGAFSDNIVTETTEEVVMIQEDNFVAIFNNVEALMNTGENEANFNTDSNILIITGEVIAHTIIETIANINVVEAAQPEKQEESEKPEQPKGDDTANQPETTTATTSVAGASGSSTGNTSNAASQILPVTGNNLLFFLLLANIMMFFLGAYLRLRSGRSPGYVFSR